MADEEKPFIEPKVGQIAYLENKGFGQKDGADPRAAQAAGRKVMMENASVRRMVNRIAKHEFDMSPDAKPLPEQMKAIFGGRTMTGAQMLAAARVAQGMKNFKAMQNVVEDIDGKLIERKIEAKVSYADLVAGSLELEKQQGETFVTGDDELEEGSREPDKVET